MRRKGLAAVCAAMFLTVLSGCGKGAENMDVPETDSAEGEMTEPGADGAAGGRVSDGVMVQSGVGIDPERVTFSILGDSISTFRGYNPEGYSVFFPEFGDVAAVEETWWYQAADDLDMELCVNASSSGATVAGDSTGTDDPQCGCNEFRTGGLAGPDGVCPDRIIIFMGTNDLLFGIPLGDNDGNREVEEGVVENFSDAYTLMLNKVQANYPSAEIYCCTLLPVGDYGTDTPYVAFVTDEKLTAADYSEAIIRIAGNRGLSVIDLSDCGITIENLYEMTSDGVHPTAAGMACIAEAVEKALGGQSEDT